MAEQVFDPADEYAVRTVIMGADVSDRDVDPEEEAYWRSLLAWVDDHKD